ncbi:MAG: hypothetical protein KDD69_01515 [Bdellovibrionales bacterium]|nr:hypothetical protein [Bdellovibrionales bacterium]
MTSVKAQGNKRFRASSVAFACGVLALAVALQACGKKAGPRPPEALAPAPVQFLAAKGAVDAVVLSWQPPKETASGEDLVDLAGYVVKRSAYSKDEEADFEDIAEVPVPTVEPGAVPQSRGIAFRDDTVQPGKAYEYAVVGVNESGVEGGSTSVVRVTFIGESSVIETFAVGGKQ